MIIIFLYSVSFKFNYFHLKLKYVENVNQFSVKTTKDAPYVINGNFKLDLPSDETKECTGKTSLCLGEEKIIKNLSAINSIINVSSIHAVRGFDEIKNHKYSK